MSAQVLGVAKISQVGRRGRQLMRLRCGYSATSRPTIHCCQGTNTVVTDHQLSLTHVVMPPWSATQHAAMLRWATVGYPVTWMKFKGCVHGLCSLSTFFTPVNTGACPHYRVIGKQTGKV